MPKSKTPTRARGIFRLGLVLIVIAVCGVGMVLWMPIPKFAPDAAVELKDGRCEFKPDHLRTWFGRSTSIFVCVAQLVRGQCRECSNSAKQHTQVRNQVVANDYAKVLVGILPPVFLLMTGAALGWAIGGFYDDENASSGASPRQHP